MVTDSRAADPARDRAGPHPEGAAPSAPPAPLTDLEETEIRADIRAMRAELERLEAKPLVDRDRWLEYVEVTNREIARLEAMLSSGWSD